jgi:hypothetical protein
MSSSSKRGRGGTVDVTQNAEKGKPKRLAGRASSSLGAKGDLDREIQASARGKIEQHGIKLASVGIKDVILPGEMKEILNRVVEAEKVAQANLIKRREETAATRSLLRRAQGRRANPGFCELRFVREEASGARPRGRAPSVPVAVPLAIRTTISG